MEWTTGLTLMGSDAYTGITPCGMQWLSTLCALLGWTAGVRRSISLLAPTSVQPT